MIRMIVDRCHVGESNLSVIRYVVSRLKPGAWRRMEKSQRRYLVAECVKAHAENRELYGFVMGARIP